MFSFRRKPKKAPVSPGIRTSPSLPELNSQGIPWPEELVDIDAIRPDPSADTAAPHHKGAAKISFHMPDNSIPQFHKPFNRSLVGNAPPQGPISALYTSSPPSAFDKKAGPFKAPRYSQRRARVPPTFNLMVIGGKGTGKTSLLRLLLETADMSPGATPDQRAAVEQFLKGSPKATAAIQTACVEICESRFDRVLLSVIDTPGLDFQEGRELKLERQVNAVLKYIDAQYADTMSEESKVIRQSKGDQHIHLSIYMVDPASIMTAAARNAASSAPFTKTRSETTVSMKNPPDLVPDTSSNDDSDEEEEEDEDSGPLTMSPSEIRVIKRLSARTNVLPVIARSDSLTDERLQAVKEAVRTGLAQAGIDFGVFGPVRQTTTTSASSRKRQTSFSDGRDVASSTDGHANGSTNGHRNGTSNGIPEVAEEEEQAANGEDEDSDERQSRPVIKLRASRHIRPLSRSRSRRDLSRAAEEDGRRPVSPDANDRESVANVRFSAHIVAKTDPSDLMPFALIAPEPSKRRPRVEAQVPVLVPASVQGDGSGNGNAASPTSPEQQLQSEQASSNGHEDPSSAPDGAVSPVSTVGKHYAFLQQAHQPQDLKGVFVRKFRWGTIDVLDPNHCDFAALRTAVLSTHLKVLKTHTREVLYEKFRTEKLLARRATSHISHEDRQRLLQDLGL